MYPVGSCLSSWLPVPQSVQPDGYVYELNFPTMKAIATEVGRDWKMLARHLGLDEGIIQSIHQANFGDLHEASLQALLRYVLKHVFNLSVRFLVNKFYTKT